MPSSGCSPVAPWRVISLSEVRPLADPEVARPLRKDAARNRKRLLAAAGDVFDAQGLDASVADVARAAGVGMGTLYRRFPTKEALIDALVHEVLEATIEMARESANRADGTGLEDFLRKSSAFQAAHPGCLPKLWNTDHDMVKTARSLIGELLADAQRQHKVRHDLTGTDVTLLMWSVRGIVESTRSVAPTAWQRHLDVLLAGIRPSSEDLAHRTVTRKQLDAILEHG